MRCAVLLLILGGLGQAELPFQALPFRPLAERQSWQLDRLIFISANPDELHIYEPVSGADTKVALPKSALSLDVSPDGGYAAVGHDGALSWINLTTASLISTSHVPGTVSSVILGSNYAWIGPANGSLDLQTGQFTPLNFGGSGGVLSLDEKSIYVYDANEPESMTKYAVSGGTIGPGKLWPYFAGDYPGCGPFYLSADGTRIYLACGTVVHVSSDPSMDMYYAGTLPVSSSPIAGFAESASSHLLAAIPAQITYPVPDTNADTVVELFSNSYLNPAGTLSLQPFTTPAGSFPSHGQAVFFSQDSSRLYAIVQADSQSNLQNDFAVQTFDLGAPAACDASFASSSASVSSDGSLGSVGINAPPDCLYTATSNDDWIQITTGGYGSGNGTLGWIVRPNSSKSARTGSITLGAQIFTLTQQAAGSQIDGVLSFAVVDAAYSKALDKIVAISADPNELHIYDPGTAGDAIVPLVSPPFSLSLSPDGTHAAVGQDAWISYVDLKLASVARIYPIVTDAHHVLLAGNGYIYGFPQQAASNIYSMAVGSGAVVATDGIYDGRIPRLEPNDRYFYLGDATWFSKWSISNGAASRVPLPVNGAGSIACGNYWLYEDGSQLISSCGKLYGTSDVESTDLQYTGTFGNSARLQWAANSTALAATALVPAGPSPSFYEEPPGTDTIVQFYGDAYLGYAGTWQIPEVSVGGALFPVHGQYLFWNSSSSKLYVIANVDTQAGLASPYRVITIDPQNPPQGCSISLNGNPNTIPAQGGFGTANILAGSDCPWGVTSSSSWLTVTSGTVGAGPAAVSWSATANSSSVSRAGTFSVGGKSYQVTQLGTGSIPLTLSANSLSFSADGGAIPSQTFTVTAAAGFLVSANMPWIAVSPSSGSAAGTISVGIKPAGLSVGTHVGSVTVTGSDLQTQTVVITLAVAPVLTASPSSVSLSYTSAASPPSATVQVSSGDNGAFTAYAPYFATVTPTSGNLPATLKITMNTAFSPGTYSGSISVSEGPKSLNIPLQVTTVTSTPVVNALAAAGDFQVGPVSPGEIVVLSGSGVGPSQLTLATAAPGFPLVLSGTQVSFDSHAAPLIYTSSGAVAAVVPYELAGQTHTSVVVNYAGSSSLPLTVRVAPTAPHFFTSKYTPQGQLVALNADYSVNSASNPAGAGGVVILWASGEGVTSPPGIDGSLVGSPLTQPLASVAVTIGGQAANVLYAGGSPGSVEGLLQINVRIPAGVAASGQVPVELKIGSASAPSGGTIAVR